MMNFSWSLVIIVIFTSLTLSQVLDVHRRDPNGFISFKDDKQESSSLYTSMYQLTQFFKEEKAVIKDLEVILEKKLVSLEARGAISDYIYSFEDIWTQNENYLHHPLNVYHLIRHVAVGWSLINETLSQEKILRGQLSKRVSRVLHRNFVPGEKDLNGVAAGIVRLHDFYHFNLSLFTEEGIFQSKDFTSESIGELTVWDIFKIGVQGTNLLYLGSGIDIMEAGLRKALIEGFVTTPSFVEPLEIQALQNIIKTAKTVHDQKLDRWGSQTFTHSTHYFPYNERLAKKKKFERAARESTKIRLNTAQIVDSIQETKQYIRLCNGEDLRDESVKKHLFCFYETKNLPYYIIGPRKIEVFSIRPYVLMIHNFITESEASEIISVASPNLKRSRMMGKFNNGSFLMDERRISEQSWLMEHQSMATSRLTKRILSFLNLQVNSTEHSELYQVANYGLAGQYSAHYDQVLMSTSKNSLAQRDVFNRYAGDRLATIMGYLTDVSSGGYTVFPLIGTYVPPTKGSVLLWWNMDQAGGYDVLTRHGGCPVLIGSKWILNKWVRSHSQMFTRPCPKYTSRQIRSFRNKDAYQKGGWFTDL